MGTLFFPHTQSLSWLPFSSAFSRRRVWQLLILTRTVAQNVQPFVKLQEFEAHLTSQLYGEHMTPFQVGIEDTDVWPIWGRFLLGHPLPLQQHANILWKKNYPRVVWGEESQAGPEVDLRGVGREGRRRRDALPLSGGAMLQKGLILALIN